MADILHDFEKGVEQMIKPSLVAAHEVRLQHVKSWCEVHKIEATSWNVCRCLFYLIRFFS